LKGKRRPMRVPEIISAGHHLICPRIIGCDHGGRGPGTD
jgi:hypothetical protein